MCPRKTTIHHFPYTITPIRCGHITYRYSSHALNGGKCQLISSLKLVAIELYCDVVHVDIYVRTHLLYLAFAAIDTGY